MKKVFITISNLNEAPTDISLSSSVQENLPTVTVVGSFTPTDSDACDAHTYSLVSGSSDSGSFSINGSNLPLLCCSSAALP